MKREIGADKEGLDTNPPQQGFIDAIVGKPSWFWKP